MTSLNCTICNTAGASPCTSCNSTAYCPRPGICQDFDAPIHKLLCKTFTSLPTRPSEAHKLSIHFPAEEKTPLLIWVECVRRVIDDNVFEEEAQVAGLIEVQHSTRFQQSKIRGFELGRTISIKFRDQSPPDYMVKPNQSIVQVTRDAADRDWKGAVLVMRRPGTVLDMGSYEDVTLADFRHAVDWFTSPYGDEKYFFASADPVDDPDMAMDIDFCGAEKGTILGVKIACNGDQRTYGEAKCASVRVPKDHPVLNPGPVPDASRMIELPLLVYRLPADPAWTASIDDEGNEEDPFYNLPATFLHSDFNPYNNDVEWGLAPRKWQKEVGSVVVVRQDGGDLLPQHVDALFQYLVDTVEPALVQSWFDRFEDDLLRSAPTEAHKDRLEHSTAQGEVLTMLKKESFEAFFNRYRTLKKAEDEAWADVASPYQDAE